MTPLWILLTATVPAIVPRAAWNAAPATKAVKQHQISSITLHHTATPASDPARAKKRILSIQKYHQGHRQYADIAYHYLISEDGTIFEGRDRRIAGETSTNYDPTGHVLVALLGNFEKAPPTKRQWASMIELLAWLCTEFGVSPESISGHRDLAKTLCPGKYLDVDIKNRKVHRSVINQRTVPKPQRTVPMH